MITSKKIQCLIYFTISFLLNWNLAIGQRPSVKSGVLVDTLFISVRYGSKIDSIQKTSISKIAEDDIVKHNMLQRKNFVVKQADISGQKHYIEFYYDSLRVAKKSKQITSFVISMGTLICLPVILISSHAPFIIATYYTPLNISNIRAQLSNDLRKEDDKSGYHNIKYKSIGGWFRSAEKNRLHNNRKLKESFTSYLSYLNKKLK